jgi:pimeloyl-ACP methyl ester carboxylesterase
MATPIAGLNAHRAGEGEPLVLLHGIGLTHRSWTPVLPALERSHDVIALDLPGFGESPPLPQGRPSTVPSLVDAVEGVLEEAGLDDAHVAGNSLGGWVALELARRGRARSVVGLSPAGMWTRREIAYARWNLDLQRTGARVLAPYADSLARTAGGRTLLLGGAMSRPWRPQPEEAAGMIRAAAAARGWRETLDWTSTRRAEGLEEVGCPVLIAWGSRDTLLLPRQGPRFVRRIPHAEHRPLRGLGHVPMWDDPELVASTIVEFTHRAREGASAQAAAAGS